MVEQELLDYIKKELSKGSSLERIKCVLIECGWPKEKVSEAIDTFAQQKVVQIQNDIVYIKKFLVKHYLLAILASVVLCLSTFLLIGGWVLLVGGNADCGTNIDWFIFASQFCKQSKVTFNTTTEMREVLTTGAMFYQINSAEQNKCVLYFNESGGQILHFSDTLIQDMLEQGKSIEQIQKEENNINDPMTNKVWTCVFNDTANMASLLNKVKSGELLIEVSCDSEKCSYGGDLAVADCSLA